MKLFYSKKVELKAGNTLKIGINDALPGDISLSELWINSVGDETDYTVEEIIRSGETSDEDIWQPLTKGIDMDGFSLVEEGEYSTRMLFVISDAKAIAITANADAVLDIKLLY